jgi:hypothetical protein
MCRREGKVMQRRNSGIVVAKAIARAQYQVAQGVADGRLQGSRHGHVDDLKKQVLLGDLRSQLHQGVTAIPNHGDPVARYRQYLGFRLRFHRWWLDG